HGIMATSLREIRLVDGTGTPRTLTPADDDFRHAGVALGLLGVITHVTFACEPRFGVELRTDVVSFDDYVRDPVMQESRTEFHASVWDPNARRVVRFAGERTALPRRPRRRELRFGYRTAISTFLSRRLRLDWAVANWNFRRTVSGDAADILSPVRVRPQTVQFRIVANGLFQLAAELAVDAARAPEVLERLDGFFRRRRRYLRNPIGLRMTRGDGFSLSPAHERDTLWLDVFFYNREPFMSEFRELIDELDAREHWGKTLVSAPHALRARYPAWDAFREARARFDPEGVFGNALSDRYGLTRPRVATG
ncbi:MAG: hypothetical protein D6701_15380, partial [Gemmatimonadetes bacterium]